MAKQTEYRLAFGDESELADRIRDLIGAGRFEEIPVILPSFERPEGQQDPWFFPESREAVNLLRTLPRDVLRSMGMRKFEDWDDKEVWLFPAEWFDVIPEGIEIVTINGDVKEFRRDDFGPSGGRRLGTLSFGVLVDTEKAAGRTARTLGPEKVAAAVKRLPVSSLASGARRIAGRLF